MSPGRGNILNHPFQPRVLPAITTEQLAEIAALAGVIWRAVYPAIISNEQIEYMLARMYSLPTLLQETQTQSIRFYCLFVEEQIAGFASVGPTAAREVWKLHKLYLRPELHGRGLGRLLLQHCEAEAQRLGARRLILSVNKRNTRAIVMYQKHGFATTDSVVTDIGGGFVMDDFVMAKTLAAGNGQKI